MPESKLHYRWRLHLRWHSPGPRSGGSREATAWCQPAHKGPGEARVIHAAIAHLHAAQHSTAQHSTAQHSTAQHSTAQHSTAQHSTAQSAGIQMTWPRRQEGGLWPGQDRPATSDLGRCLLRWPPSTFNPINSYLQSAQMYAVVALSGTAHHCPYFEVNRRSHLSGSRGNSLSEAPSTTHSAGLGRRGCRVRRGEKGSAGQLSSKPGSRVKNAARMLQHVERLWWGADKLRAGPQL
jgi:hypothetical protein